jgi:hypothetical protein
MTQKITRQAYFAVAVNDDGSMYVDHDISINYDESPIWNEETEKWEDISEHESFYDLASEALTGFIRGSSLSLTPDEGDVCENCKDIIAGGNPFSRFCDTCEPLNFDVREVN